MDIKKIEKLMREIEKNWQLIQEELANQSDSEYPSKPSDSNEQPIEKKEDELISHIFAKLKCESENLESFKRRALLCLQRKDIYNMSDLGKSSYRSLSKIYGMGGKTVILVMTVAEKYYEERIFVLPNKMRQQVEELKKQVKF